MIITGATGCFTGATGSVLGSFVSNEIYSHTAQFDNRNVDLECTSNLFDAPWFERGTDEFIDYDKDGVRSTGDLVIFDYNRLVPGGNGPLGSVSGRCFFRDNPEDPAENSYCTIVFLYDEGGIVAEGFYNEMTIIGSSGCFAGLTGNVRGIELGPDTFQYIWTLD